MPAQAYNCPSCAAPLAVENRFSKLVVCSYCGQASLISDKGLDPTGEKAKLADFPSILSVGASGRIRSERFRVLGRLRYKYEDGFWDEWFLAMKKGKKVWLQEDEGEFVVFEKERLTSPLAPFDDITVGSLIEVNGRQVFVTEKNRAVIAGGQGELSFRIAPGQVVNCVDGNSQGRLVSVEFLPEEIDLSLGEEISVTDIEMDAS